MPAACTRAPAEGASGEERGVHLVTRAGAAAAPCHTASGPSVSDEDDVVAASAAGVRPCEGRFELRFVCPYARRARTGASPHTAHRVKAELVGQRARRSSLVSWRWGGMSLVSKGCSFVPSKDAHFVWKRLNKRAFGPGAGCQRLLQNKFVYAVTAGQVEHVLLDPLLDERTGSCTEAGVRYSSVETECFHSILQLSLIERC